MKRNKKKGFAMSTLLGAILSVFTIIIVIFILYPMLTDRYTTSIDECSYFFKNIDGKPSFFTPKLDEATPVLINSISNICPSRSIIIKKNNINSAVKLVDDCFKKTGSGEDIMGANTQEEGISLFCGKIEAGEDIPNFGEIFLKEYDKDKYDNLRNKDIECNNLNSHFLSKNLIPKSLNKGEKISVFYYTYKPYPSLDGSFFHNFDLFLRDVYGTKITNLIAGKAGRVGSLFSYFVSQSTSETQVGIILFKDKEQSENDFGNVKSSFSIQGTNIIIPYKNYD